MIPRRGTENFLSTIGQLDGRIDLYKGQYLVEQLRDSDVGQRGIDMELGNRILMDLCIMASKLAYENAEVVRNVVVDHWKVKLFYLLFILHFLPFLFIIFPNLGIKMFKQKQMHFVDFYNCWNGKYFGYNFCLSRTVRTF